MSLRLRLVLGIVFLVGLTVLLAGAVQHRVMRPFADQVFRGFVAQSVFVAERVEKGADPEAIGERIGLDVQFVPGPPDDPAVRKQIEVDRRGKGRGKGQRKGRRRWSDHPSTNHPHDRIREQGRTLVFPRGPRDRVYVETSRGWVLVGRDLDLQAPGRTGLFLLLLGGLVVVALASLLAALSTRPLNAATVAMDRIAEGDLAHRLDAEVGAPELRHVARAFNRMADRVDHLLRSEKQLMAAVSHDLRTPLSRMRLELELLRDLGPSDKRLDDMTADIVEIDELIGELLALSRLQLGDGGVSKVSTDLAALAREAVDTARLADHPVSVHGAATLHVDAGLVRRLLANLLQNAGRYTPAGTEVRITVHSQGLDVEDAGPGVPEEALAQLFDPFYRVETSRSRSTGGTGLGLMVVAEVARAHGGEATASRSAMGGLRVSVRLG